MLQTLFRLRLDKLEIINVEQDLINLNYNVKQLLIF